MDKLYFMKNKELFFFILLKLFFFIFIIVIYKIRKFIVLGCNLLLLLVICLRNKLICCKLERCIKVGNGELVLIYIFLLIIF